MINLSLTPKQILALPLVRRAAFIAAASVALLLIGIATRYGVFAATTGKAGFTAYVDALCAWDCAWYSHIVENGYDLTPSGSHRPGAANWAFFPAYPASLAVFQWFTFLPLKLAGFVLSNLFTIAAIVAARPLFEKPAPFWMFAFLLTNGPFAVVFSTLYTESLFVLLTILVLTQIKKDRLLRAGLFAALLSATRATGFLMTLALLVELLRRHLQAGGRLAGFLPAVLKNSRWLLMLALAPLGLMVFATYLYFHTGDALAFAHIQRAWGRDLGNPFMSVWTAITPVDALDPNAMIIATWGWAALIGLTLSGFAAWRRHWIGAVFSTLSILLSLCTGVGSMVRFVAGLAPITIAAAELLTLNRIVALLSVPVIVGLDLLVTTGWFRASMFLM